jgi:hypothetical protein
MKSNNKKINFDDEEETEIENELEDFVSLSVIKVCQEYIEFDNGVKLLSEHEQDCCENHYLSFSDLSLDDFDGLLFDLSNDEFFKKIDGYGIELIPMRGFSVRIPGYGYNNGYYSTNLTLVITNDNDFNKSFDISECQDISE